MSLFLHLSGISMGRYYGEKSCQKQVGGGGGVGKKGDSHIRMVVYRKGGWNLLADYASISLVHAWKRWVF